MKYLQDCEERGYVSKETVVLHRWEYYKIIGVSSLCISQIEASTSPLGIPRAFDVLSCPGGREFD